jgi:SNF2 family DNA or RNA helicase
MRKLQTLLKLIMLRRTKSSTLDGKPIIVLPPKVIETVHVVFNEDENKFYRDLEASSQVQFSKFLKNGTVGKKYASVLLLLLRLRQACCHPYLHLMDLEDGGNNGVGESAMLELARTLAPNVVQRIKEVDTFECPICYDAVQNPSIMLPCGHDVCSECFSKLTDSSAQRAIQAGQENASANCPECRGPIDPTQIISYAVFQQVHMPEKPEATPASDNIGNGYDTDEDSSDFSDSDTDDGRGFAHGSSDVDHHGNLKGFIDYGDEESHDDAGNTNQPEAKLSTTSRSAAQDDEMSDLEDLEALVTKRHPHNSKKASKGKKVRSKPKSRRVEEHIQPSTLKKLRKESSKNRKSYKRYMEYLRHIWEPSAKVTKCSELITEIQPTGEKTIVFSQWTLLLDLLEVPLKHELKVGYRRYDGGMSGSQRDAAVSDFMEKPDVKVILVSLKAGNAGLNLTAASQIIIMDPFWNPYTEYQAIDRAHRIGQQRPVKVHRVLVQETVEDRIMELQERKRDLVENALSEEAAKSVGALTAQDFAYLFGVAPRLNRG